MITAAVNLDVIEQAVRGLIRTWLRGHPVGQQLALLYPDEDAAIDRALALCRNGSISMKGNGSGVDFHFHGRVPPELLDPDDGSFRSPVLQALWAAEGILQPTLDYPPSFQ